MASPTVARPDHRAGYESTQRAIVEQLWKERANLSDREAMILGQRRRVSALTDWEIYTHARREAARRAERAIAEQAENERTRCA
jgi:hypothetical protein